MCSAPRTLTFLSKVMSTIFKPLILGQPFFKFIYLYAEVKVDKQSIGGCGGLMRRKKGAVAIFLNYRGIRMLFISCHLSGMRPTFIILFELENSFKTSPFPSYESSLSISGMFWYLQLTLTR